MAGRWGLCFAAEDGQKWGDQMLYVEGSEWRNVVTDRYILWFFILSLNFILWGNERSEKKQGKSSLILFNAFDPTDRILPS
jgi:hypothetical protein